jgi:CheY-like chemotaxis protein
MDTIIRILHLENDPLDAELVQARLAETGLACRTIRVQTREEFESALGRNEYEVILSDYRLPMYDGLSALRYVLKVCPDIPFIFLSGTIGEDAAIEALTKGATDYVLKQNLKRLGSAVKRALEDARNRRDRRQAEAALAISEAMMRTILDSVDEGFIVIDRDYRIVSVNRAFCSLVNLREDQVIGVRCHEISHNSARPCFSSGEACPVKRTFETGRSHTAIHTHKDASGAHLYMDPV